MTKTEKELKRIALHQAIIKASKEHDVLMMVRCQNALKALDALPVEEDIYAATHELTHEEKVELYHKMMTMYCMADLLDGMSVDFEEALKMIAPSASTSTRMAVASIRKTAHSLVNTIDRQFDKALAEDYGEVCDELSEMVCSFIAGDKRIKGITEALIKG